MTLDIFLRFFFLTFNINDNQKRMGSSASADLRGCRMSRIIEMKESMEEEEKEEEEERDGPMYRLSLEGTVGMEYA